MTAWILLGMVSFYVSAGSVWPIGQPKPSAQDLRQLEQWVFEIVNQERKKAKKTELLWDDAVARAARSHSENMGKRRFFSHQDPRLGGLERRLRRFRIPWDRCGENIWMIQGSGFAKDLYAIAQRAVSEWMRSPGHRANILSAGFTHLGVGAYYDPQRNAYYLTQIFTHPSTYEKQSR